MISSSFPQINPEFFEEPRQLPIHLGFLPLDLRELAEDRLQVDLFLFFRGVDVARNVEVEVVLPNLVERRQMRVLLDILAVDVRPEDLLQVFRQKVVLRALLLEVL